MRKIFLFSRHEGRRRAPSLLLIVRAKSPLSGGDPGSFSNLSSPERTIERSSVCAKFIKLRRPLVCKTNYISFINCYYLSFWANYFNRKSWRNSRSMPTTTDHFRHCYISSRFPNSILFFRSKAPKSNAELTPAFSNKTRGS